MRNCICVIRRSALLHNLQRVRELRPNARILAMVKADAYGHGLVAVAQTIEPVVDALGVAVLEEAFALRAAGIQIPIVLMEGVFSAQELTEVRRLDLRMVVHQQRQIDWLHSSSTAVDVWLKLNTGMNRLGFRPEQLPAVWAQLSKLVQPGHLTLMTHLAQADQKQDPSTLLQYQQFMSSYRMLGSTVPTSVSNSAAILAWPQLGGDWVRPGLMLYGASPFADESAKALGLLPVMQFRAQVMAIQEVTTGESVGYGRLWTAPQDQRVAIVNCGYGDGYPRTVRSGTPVAIAGQVYGLAGRVSMDMLAVDIGHASIEVGAPVELWGDQVDVDVVAQCAGTLSYELFCKLTNRVDRVMMD